MDQEISSDEARRNFRDLINAVEVKGQHVTVTRYGNPAAVIVPVNWYEAARGQMAQDG